MSQAEQETAVELLEKAGNRPAACADNGSRQSGNSSFRVSPHQV